MPNVQIGHFSPDAPSVDIVVDGETAFENLGFRDISDQANLDEGSHHVEVRVSGEDEAVIETDLDLDGNMHYVVIASGLVGEDDLDLAIISHED